MSSSPSKPDAQENPQSAPSLGQETIIQAEAASIRSPQDLDGSAHLDKSVSTLQGTPKLSIEQVPSPAYGQTYGRVDFSQDGFDTKARVAGKSHTNSTQITNS